MEKCYTERQAKNNNILQRMHLARWITKATDTHSEYVILATFPWQQWLRESTSMSCYTYIACLVKVCMGTAGSTYFQYHYK
jgi:hypothetical protein